MSLFAALALALSLMFAVFPSPGAADHCYPPDPNQPCTHPPANPPANLPSQTPIDGQPRLSRELSDVEVELFALLDEGEDPENGDNSSDEEATPDEQQAAAEADETNVANDPIDDPAASEDGTALITDSTPLRDEPVKMVVKDLQPRSKLVIGHESEYRELGTEEVGDDGVVRTTIVIPEDTEPGEHEMVFRGTRNGEPVEIRIPFTVMPAAFVRPADVLAAQDNGASSLLWVLGAGAVLAVMALVMRRRRREGPGEVAAAETAV